MTWKPNYDDDWTGSEVKDITDLVPQRGDNVHLDPFRHLDEEGKPTGEIQPERDIEVLAIDWEINTWVCRDRLTREILLVAFDPRGRWTYKRIERTGDPDGDE